MDLIKISLSLWCWTRSGSYLFFLLYLTTQINHSNSSILNSNYDENGLAGICSLEMFSNNSDAFWACRAQYALQRNWFPDPIQGLFSYQSWNGMVLHTRVSVRSRPRKNFFKQQHRYWTGYGITAGTPKCAAEVLGSTRRKQASRRLKMFSWSSLGLAWLGWELVRNTKIEPRRR